MKALRLLSIVLLVLGVLPQALLAQYWGERVLEKSFEQTDFFFVPNALSPYGIGNFKSTTPGLLRDPLLDLVINPASLGLDTLGSHYLYTDFRAVRQVTEKETGYVLPWVDMAQTAATSDRFYYSRLYLNTRREVDPIFSGAYIGRPFPETMSDLFVAITYQHVMQDDKYYNIPQDIYRSAIGYDYTGMRVAAADNIPIVDKYTGKDNMHHGGSFLTGYLRYSLPAGLDIGAKVSRVSFSRDGAFGSANLWEYSPYSPSTSLWSNLESREQSYDHWELGLGVEYHLTDQTTIGASAGHLWGRATQSLRNNDSSYYSYSSTPNTSFYNRSGNTLHEWNHAGKTTSFGIDLRSQVTPTSTLTVYYQHRGTTVNIGLGSAILDTSYSMYTWVNGGTPSTSYSQSYLSDARGGDGRQSVATNRLMASLQWKVDRKVTLSIGAVMEWQNSEITTNEDVVATSRSAYWSTTGNWGYRYGQDEYKNLLWTFTTKRTEFQIPIFMTVRASESVELLLGLNRNLIRWRIDDVTLALFRYRRTARDGATRWDQNFGERYTQPTEEVSDVRMTFLGGLTVTPSRSLRIRMLMVPNFRTGLGGRTELDQFQWWIGMILLP